MRWPYLICGLWIGTLSVISAQAYLGPSSVALRNLMAARFGQDAREHLAAWQRGMDGLAPVNQAHLASPSDLSNASEKATLAAVNALANRADYLSDKQNWSAQDYWATPAEFVSKNAGDCEDYVIAKYYALRTLGVAGDKLRLIYARAFFQGELTAHMVLAWYSQPDAEPLILDNINPRLLPASQRPDLSPVYSFNDEGVWRGSSSSTVPPAAPIAALSPWRDLQRRVRAEMAL